MKTTTIKDWPGPVGELQVHHNLPASPSNYNACLARNVGDIVMHYTGNKQDTARGNANYFHTGSRGASAHFFVDETSIWQSVGLRDMAWHFSADKYKHPTARNYNTIGIEMCTSGGYRVSEKTKENGAQLCAEMCKLLNIGPSEVDKHVHRHWDMTGKNCPAQMAGEGNQEWAQFKARVKQILEGDDEMLSYEDFKKYMERYTADSEYAILVFHDRYDIPAKASDKERLGESEEMFEYLICIICPFSGEYEPGEPECGFLFPAFTDRCGDLNHVNIYQRNLGRPHMELVSEILGAE